MNKKELRNEMIQKLSAFKKEDKLKKEQDLYKNLQEYMATKKFKSVGLVLSMSHEIDTWPVIDSFIDSNVRVYGPKCNYKDKSMNFYEIHNRAEITKDEKGILVPDESNILDNKVDLLLVPGLIFNEKGYRTGYGGGFYDRFLAHYTGQTVSLLFDEQFGDVIVKEHDLPVDVLITPTRIINAEEERKK